ncbi:MAG: aminotransferase class IV [Rickettsiaceae bacterium]|nr:aminotransferase class IV [Rickettsiaceae bacterium]
MKMITKLTKKLSEYIWLNGEFVKHDEAMIHVLTHSLHYSGAVYEGARAYNGKVFLLQEHIERLFASAKAMKLNINYSVADIMQITDDVLTKNNLSNAYIRPLVWRGDESINIFNEKLKTNIMIAAVDSKPEFNNGFKLNISPWRKIPPQSFPLQCKSSSQYALATVNNNAAMSQGFDDSISLDIDDYIAECSVSNIFFAKDKQIVTPKADKFFNGLTRQAVIKMTKNLGFEVIETRLKLQDINKFDCCFLTGTAKEITGVSLIDCGEQKINFANDQLTKDLQKEFAKMVGR